MLWLLHCDQVWLKWDTDESVDRDIDYFQLMVDGSPVGEPLKKTARQVNIDGLKPGQELDVSLMTLDGSKRPLGSSGVLKASDSIVLTFFADCTVHTLLLDSYCSRTCNRHIH